MDYTSEIEILKNSPSVVSVEVVLGDSITTPVSNHFYVKIKKDNDTEDLEQLAENTKTRILRPISFCDKWYVLEVDKYSVSDCIGVARIFTESNLFEEVDPGFIFNFSPACRSDAQYGDQWAIDDSGVDINACDAWDITTGSSDVIVAVIDQGIAKNHDEFNSTAFTSTSYDAQSGTSPAQLSGIHGTNVTGIISSDHDASEIAGVAPGLKIMDVSHDLYISNDISEELAEGINWAVNNGADILNNSWRDKGGMVNWYLLNYLS